MRVRATTICAEDYRVKKMWPMRFVFGLAQRRKYTILGMELAGTVESVGSAVTRFRPQMTRLSAGLDSSSARTPNMPVPARSR